MTRHECLNENDLFRLVEGQVADVQRNVLLERARDCKVCTTKLAGMFADGGSEVKMTSRAKANVQAMIAQRRRESTPLWKQLYFSPHVWFAACLVSIAASFFVPGYYKQFLVLSLVCGGKWLLESRSAKTHITVIRQDGNPSTGESHRWKHHA